MHGFFASLRMTAHKKTGDGHLCRLPSKTVELRSTGRVKDPSLHKQIASLRGFAWSLGFEGLLAAHVDFDLLGFGFRLFRQVDLQDSLVVGRRDLLRIHGLGQGEGASEASILPLYATEILFFLFLF